MPFAETALQAPGTTVKAIADERCVGAVISVDEVDRQAAKLGGDATRERIAALAGKHPYLSVDRLTAGYGKMPILHDFNLRVARGQSLCLIGPNGAGKSTALHAIYGLADIFTRPRRLRRRRARIADGSFGICTDCGNAIGWKRLKANPVARRCTVCQALREKHFIGVA